MRHQAKKVQTVVVLSSIPPYCRLQLSESTFHMIVPSRYLPKSPSSLENHAHCTARVMLVLFCSSVLLKKHDVIPTDEIIFYVFAAVSTLHMVPNVATK